MSDLLARLLVRFHLDLAPLTTAVVPDAACTSRLLLGDALESELEEHSLAERVCERLQLERKI